MLSIKCDAQSREETCNGCINAVIEAAQAAHKAKGELVGCIEEHQEETKASAISQHGHLSSTDRENERKGEISY